MNIHQILLIDDDPDYRKLLVKILTGQHPDAEIEEYDPVVSGRPGDEFPWTNYDLLLLDYNLGDGENGLDWLRHYKKDESFPATVMLTAEGNEDIAARSIRLGAHEYLSKRNFSRERLAEAVENAGIVRSEHARLVSAQNLRTTLFNKVFFYRKLRELLDRGEGDEQSFILQIMLDDYQRLNHELGILRADQLVSEIAEQVSHLLMSDAYELSVTRTGDATIGCLVSGAFSQQDSARLTEVLCKNLGEARFLHEQQPIQFSVSIGIARITCNEPGIESLLRNVTQACDEARAKPGNSFAVYQDSASQTQPKPAAKPKPGATGAPTAAPSPGAAPAPQSAPATGPEPGGGQKQPAAPAATSRFDLQGAIRDNRLQPYFQQLIPLSEQATKANLHLADLQVQMIDPKGTSFTLNELAPGLQYGQKSMLDSWMVRFALGKLLALKKQDDNSRQGLLIPLSGESLSTRHFHDWMARLVNKTGEAGIAIASTIVFEMNPTDFLSGKQLAQDLMKQMREEWDTTFALNDVVNKSVLKTCVGRGRFEYVRLRYDANSTTEIREIAALSREAGVRIILDNIHDADGLYCASAAEVDFALGDFIQPPQDELFYNFETIEESQPYTRI